MNRIMLACTFIRSQMIQSKQLYKLKLAGGGFTLDSDSIIEMNA